MPSWLWRCIRRLVPEPALLHHLLKEFFECWGPIKCSGTNMALFSAESKAQCENILKQVQQGYVSDPAGFSLYVFLCHDKNGLPIYRCLRGTNSVEGGVHMVILRKFGALNAAPQLADCAVADWRHRHNQDVCL